MSAAAALANLQIIESEKLVQNAARMGERLQRRLRDALAGHPRVGDVRGLGMMAGVELMADPAARTPFDPADRAGRRAHELLLDEGLLTRALGDTIALSPALCASEAEIDEIVERLVRGLARLSLQP